MYIFQFLRIHEEKSQFTLERIPLEDVRSHAKSMSLAGGGGGLKNCHFAVTNEPFFTLLGIGPTSMTGMTQATFQTTNSSALNVRITDAGAGPFGCQPMCVGCLGEWVCGCV